MRNRPLPAAIFILAVLLLIAFELWQAHSRSAVSRQRHAERPYAENRAYEPREREYRRREGGRTREPGREAPASCGALGLTCSSAYFTQWQQPLDGSCAAQTRPGSYPLPDARCTPGGINPSVTESVLRDPQWRTECTRNCQVDEAEKHATYAWYGLARPRHNSGENQVCELDHLVPLELGGADGLGNIWPECGPDNTALRQRYFKVKDRVENYLADEVRAGRMPLAQAQRGIASDWTLYLPAANSYCAAGGRCE